jgi:hypothetical protein
MHVGDSFYLLFTGNGATVMVNGNRSERSPSDSLPK